MIEKRKQKIMKKKERNRTGKHVPKNDWKTKNNKQEINKKFDLYNKNYIEKNAYIKLYICVEAFFERCAAKCNSKTKRKYTCKKINETFQWKQI